MDRYKSIDAEGHVRHVPPYPVILDARHPASGEPQRITRDCLLAAFHLVPADPSLVQKAFQFAFFVIGLIGFGPGPADYSYDLHGLLFLLTRKTSYFHDFSVFCVDPILTI